MSRSGRATDLVTDFVEHRDYTGCEGWGQCDRAHFGPEFDEWELINQIMMIDPHFHEDEKDRLRAQILELGGTLDMPHEEAVNLAVIHRDALVAWHRAQREKAS